MQKKKKKNAKLQVGEVQSAVQFFEIDTNFLKLKLDFLLRKDNFEVLRCNL